MSQEVTLARSWGACTSSSGSLAPPLPEGAAAEPLGPERAWILLLVLGVWSFDTGAYLVAAGGAHPVQRQFLDLGHHGLQRSGVPCPHSHTHCHSHTYVRTNVVGSG